MPAKFTYAIKFVADMERAVAWHRDTLGLAVKFVTPGWSEFDTGEVTLALHIASEKNPAGGVELGFTAENLAEIYAKRGENGLEFAESPRLEHGVLLAQIRDCEGASLSLSGQP